MLELRLNLGGPQRVSTMKVFYLNLTESADRRAYIEEMFSHEELVRITAVDGLQWSNGKVDEHGRYQWDEQKLQKLIRHRIIHPLFKRYYDLHPRELGCSKSHEKAWGLLLASDEPSCVVLEDDVQPTGDATNYRFEDVLRVPDGIDLLYLFSPKHPGRRIRLWPDGRVRWVRSLMGYWLNRKAAKSMSGAAYPAVYQNDWQIPWRLLEPLRSQMKSSHYPDDWEELPSIEARGLFQPLIEHSKHAKITTFTCHGGKPWIRDELLP